MMQLIETARQEMDFSTMIAYDIYVDCVKVGILSVYDYIEALTIGYIRIEEQYRHNGYGSDAIYEVSKGHDYIYAAPQDDDSRQFFNYTGNEVSDDSDWMCLDHGYGVYQL